MRYIRDFFYNFSDIILALIVTIGIGYVLFLNLNYLVNIETQASTNTISTNEVVNKNELEIDVIISSNLSIEQLADILNEYKIISNKKDFIEYFSKLNLIIKSGQYTLKQNMSNEELENIIFNK